MLSGREWWEWEGGGLILSFVSCLVLSFLSCLASCYVVLCCFDVGLQEALYQTVHPYAPQLVLRIRGLVFSSRSFFWVSVCLGFVFVLVVAQYSLSLSSF